MWWKWGLAVCGRGAGLSEGAGGLASGAHGDGAGVSGTRTVVVLVAVSSEEAGGPVAELKGEGAGVNSGTARVLEEVRGDVDGEGA